MHMCGAAAADDVVQDTFVALLGRPARYDPSRGSILSYLFGIARHHVSKRLAVRGNESPLDTPDDVVDDATPLDLVSRDELVGQVREAIQSLPPAYREAVVLCELQEMDYATAAAIMHCPDRHRPLAAAQGEGDVDDEAGRASGRAAGDHEADTMTERQTVDRVLADALRVIADQDAHASASPDVEARVMAAFNAVAMARRRRARSTVAGLAAAAAIVTAVAVFKFEVRSLKSDRTSQTSDFKLQTSSTSSSEVTTAFMPLAYSSVPIVDGHVVRMEVPRASLVSFGLLPMDSPDGAKGTSSGTVLADVIVGDDGLARAVRFVRGRPRAEERKDR
jgi:RNA polymerase sigma factor (sigma-70 family)